MNIYACKIRLFVGNKRYAYIVDHERNIIVVECLPFPPMLALAICATCQRQLHRHQYSQLGSANSDSLAIA